MLLCAVHAALRCAAHAALCPCTCILLAPWCASFRPHMDYLGRRKDLNGGQRVATVLM